MYGSLRNEFTALKDRSFGLGTIASIRPDIIEKEKAKSSMRGVTFSERHSYVKGARAMGVTSSDVVRTFVMQSFSTTCQTYKLIT